MDELERMLQQAESFVKAPEQEYCMLENERSRVIVVPERYKTVGVESDEKVERVKFKFPKIVGDNIDLSTLAIFVNYENASGNKYAYSVDDVKVSGEYIEFSWLLNRTVTQFKGEIRFIVCAMKTIGEDITNEWNTTIAKTSSLEGLEVVYVIPEEDQDIVRQLIAQCTQKLTEMSVALQKIDSATTNANASAQEAKNATEDAREVIEQITKDSYLHTALESFINEVTAKPTAYGNTLIEKIDGYIRQNQPKGYQLFDASKITSKTQGGATVTSNGDGSFTISGSGVISEYFMSNQSVFENEVAKNMFREGTVYLKCEKATNPKPYVNFSIDGSTRFQLNTWKQSSMQNMITKDMIENPTFKVVYGFDGSSQEAIVTGTIKPMLYQDGDGTWEPYTGGKPAPSPDYPQVIHGVGDMGFFDGELQQGVWSSSDGAFFQTNSGVSNVNKIPAKQGDIVRIEYSEGNKRLYIIAYDDKGKFLKSYVENSGKSYLVTDALPTNTNYVNLNIQTIDYTALPVSSDKHITVTINGMYAICVKSVGKNLSYHDKTIFSPLRCEYFSDLGMLIQKTISNTTKSTIKIQTYLNKNYISQIINNLGLGKHSVKIQKTENFNFISVAFNGIAEDAYVPFYIGDIENGSYFYISFNFVSDEINKGIIEGLMITTEENTDFDFIPYQGSITYIPISSPLFAGDQLIKRNMEHKTYRKMGFAIFDGSEDEVWTEQNTEYGKCFYSRLNDAVRYKVYPDSFAKNNILQFYKNGYLSMPIYSFTFYTGELSDYKGENWIYIRLADDITSVQQAKDYLKNHNMIVVYELATPTEEDLSPEAQKAIHSIMACDEQTMIEIVGVPTDAEVQNQFLLPRNVDGALNTTAFAMSKRNEVTLEEQAQQLATMVTQSQMANTFAYLPLETQEAMLQNQYDELKEELL